MENESSQSDCPELSVQLNQLKNLHTQLAEEAQKFEQNPRYERMNYRAMIKRIEQIEEEFKFKYQEVMLTFYPINSAPEIKAALAKDYLDCLDALQEFELIKEDESNPGIKYYNGKYNGTKEAGGKGKNFVGTRFTVPPLNKILRMITLPQVELYREMIKKGERPKLQFTPVALHVSSLIAAININYDQNMFETNKGDEVWDRINDVKLVYQPDFPLKEDRLEVTGGISKSQYIDNNQGWAVEIVSTKPDIVGDAFTLADTSGSTENDAQEIFKRLDAFRKEGYSFLGLENYLICQILTRHNNQILDPDKWTVLLDVVSSDSKIFDANTGLEGKICISIDDHLFISHLYGLRKSIKLNGIS